MDYNKIIEEMVDIQTKLGKAGKRTFEYSPDFGVIIRIETIVNEKYYTEED